MCRALKGVLDHVSISAQCCFSSLGKLAMHWKLGEEHRGRLMVLTRFE